MRALAAAFGATALWLCFTSGGSLAAAGGLTLACKGTITVQGSRDPVVTSDAPASVVIDGNRLHVSFMPSGPCPITAVRPTGVEFTCPMSKFLADRVDGYLDRVSGNLSVVVMKLAADTKSVGTTTEYACKARVQVGISQPLE